MYVYVVALLFFIYFALMNYEIFCVLDRQNKSNYKIKLKLIS